MRLVTHNIMVCNVKACVATSMRAEGRPLSYPFKVRPEPDGLKSEASEFNPEFIKNLLTKLDWAALRETAAELGVAELPEFIPEGAAEDEGFLRSVHSLVMDVHVMEGTLVCPHCGRAYPIRKGIPNMLLNEDEV